MNIIWWFCRLQKFVYEHHSRLAKCLSLIMRSLFVGLNIVEDKIYWVPLHIVRVISCSYYMEDAFLLGKTVNGWVILKIVFFFWNFYGRWDECGLVPEAEVLIEATSLLDLKIAHSSITKVKEYFAKFLFYKCFFLEGRVAKFWWYKVDFICIGKVIYCALYLATYADWCTEIKTEPSSSLVIEESVFSIWSLII